MDCIPPIIKAWNSDGVIIFANQAFLNISGYRYQDIIGRNCAEFYAPQEIERVSKVYDELRDRPEGASFTSNIHGIASDGQWNFVDATTIKKNSAMSFEPL